MCRFRVGVGLPDKPGRPPGLLLIDRDTGFPQKCLFFSDKISERRV